MLTRIYLDNFRCFVNFEYRPAPRQLILGKNGSGKSSLTHAVLLIRQFVMVGAELDDDLLRQRTRWLDQPKQTAEIEALIEGKRYLYRLVLEPWGEPVRVRVTEETLHCDGKPIFEFALGEVHLFNDRFERKVTYPFDWHRSALATIVERKDNTLLWAFKRWLGELYCFQINPFTMSPTAEREERAPFGDMRNFASWYRHLLQVDPRANEALRESLRSSLDGFQYLSMQPVAEAARILSVEFRSPSLKESVGYGLGQLSDGQKCLIALYTIVHFLIAKGSTIIIDEPDNFLSLREIQPWLTAVEEAIEEGQGQVLLISHHPEILNQWAPTAGVRFVREDAGPVRVKEFSAGSDSFLTPAEIIARGWDDE
jgi:energy-coupling factor transporter ATP-binding protein EcfA2